MSETILCEHPGPAGSTCVREYGHTDDEGHRYIATYDMSREMGPLFAAVMDSAEQAREHYEKAKRRTNRMYWLWVGMFGFYVVLCVWKLFV